MKIGIIGGGMVGRATARCFMEQHEVRIYDIESTKRTHSFDDTVVADVVFLCLPTPQASMGRGACTDYISDVLAECPKNGYYVLKSTVPIGTTAKLRNQFNLPDLIHSPEFLTARCSITDAQLPSRNIIGGGPGCHYTPLAGLYKSRFPGVPILYMDSNESEAVKLILNSFFAVKVAFFNEARSLCDAHQMDWDDVLAGIMSDGRIAHSHVQVPGPDGHRGFGGACLPKDLNSFIDCLEQAGGVPHVSRAASERNNSIDRIG